MKIVTVLGTRPEIIRLSRIVPRLDRHFRHILVHTGQNADPALSGRFFAELDLRSPDYHLGIAERDFARQIAAILTGMREVFLAERPDRVLVLGDTNSALSAIVARRMNIPVFHMEAGNRCHDPRVPEEVNRRIVDQVSDVLMPYTERSRENLLREGFPGARIHVIGNPIHEVIGSNMDRVERSTVVPALNLEAGGFLLATLHRAENTDDPGRLADFASTLSQLAAEHGVPVIVSTHPRTADRLAAAGIVAGQEVRFLPPFGFADFLALGRAARCVLTDSGTVQEECAILRLPCVVLREATERPETIEAGATIVAGSDAAAIGRAVRIAVEAPPRWQAPPEYGVPAVSETVLRILAGTLPLAMPPAARH
ncbi:UDP-N-acetyl glucosamine 2-epimerase [Allostella sp. ATCC 35155]|nr:UDP-N-acetyl glucosamine 2-epimerase [Stella sp. ATCC 35155]